MKHALTWTVVILPLLFIGGVLILSNCSSLGGTISGDRLERVQASPHYLDGEFANSHPHPSLEPGEVWGYLTQWLFDDQMRVPPSALPVSIIQPTSLQVPLASGLRAIWFGHSSVYLELDGLRLLIDPVFSDYASPFYGIGPRRFHPPPIAMTDLPIIDAVMISHDHYDHLDMHTVQYLSSKGTRFVVPLGVGAHLDAWDIPQSQITELDWWDSTDIAGLTIFATPAQHYSSRGIFDYKATLWSSWSVIGPKHRVFYSGDTGYGDHFRKIGNRLGPFDLSILRIGQYGPGASWIYSQMNPEEAVQAHLAVGARRLLPVHWATFNLAFHDWDEPIKRAIEAARAHDVDLVTPRVGEVVVVGEPFRSHNWWEEVR